MLEQNETTSKKILMFILIFMMAIGYLLFSVFLRDYWTEMLLGGAEYDRPYCGTLDESGLTLLGEIDGCDVYKYNMEELAYITYNGDHRSMEQVLEDYKKNKKEDIFPINGETDVEIIDGHPVRVNRYEALVTLDLGGAMIFTHCTQDIEKAYRELDSKYN